MPHLTLHSRSIIALLASVSLGTTCLAQQTMSDADGSTVLARSLGRLPSREVVTFVANNAEPTSYLPRVRPDLAKLTTRAVIEDKCGSVQPGYLEALVAANANSPIQLEGSLGERAFTLRLPACLYVRQSQGREAFVYTVQPNDTLTGIRGRLTGDVTFNAQALDEFFAASQVKSVNAKDLKPGQKLLIPFTTAATLLQPKGSVAEFQAKLATFGDKKIESQLSPPEPGNIIGPVQFAAGPAGVTQGTFESCNGGDGSKAYPFDPAEVQAAYTATFGDPKSSGSTVSIVIADNGFFGAHCVADGACPEILGDRVRDSDRFPNAYFEFDRFRSQQGFGPKIANIEPLNFWNWKTPQRTYGSADITEETGHGTHVAGLALGGPLFMPYRPALEDGNGKPRLRLAIANLSGGSSSLPPGTDRNLAVLLRDVVGFKVVNMSVAFLGQVDPSIPKTIREALRDDSESLFVAAAGNAGADLNSSEFDWYPARLGGTVKANVVTVASIDGPSQGLQQLSEFSNRSHKYVDIAAPGCALSSWLDADHEPRYISGTSQAAPQISFTLAMLRSLWLASPAELKNRLLYSGDLLDREKDHGSVRSMSQLNMAKTLTYLWDRVSYVKDGRREVRFGTLSAMQGLVCDSAVDVGPVEFKALKSYSSSRRAIFWVNGDEGFDVCWGRLKPDLLLTLRATHELRDGRIVPMAATDIDLTAGEIEEIIKAR